MMSIKDTVDVCLLCPLHYSVVAVMGVCGGVFVCHFFVVCSV